MRLPDRISIATRQPLAKPDAGPTTASRPTGRLPAILCVSALLHAAIIAAIAKPAWLQPRPELKSLQIVLAPPPVPPALAAVPPPTPPANRRDASPARPVIARSAPTAPDPTPSRSQAVETAAAPATVEPATPAPTSAAHEPTAIVDAVAPSKGRPRPDTVAIAEYSRIVSSLVAAQRQYPGIARIRGWQGTTLLEISVDAGGHVIATRVAKSSGHDVLDRQAQEMVSKAGTLPPLPSAGREQIVMLQLPVLFALAD